MFQNMLKGFK